MNPECYEVHGSGCKTSEWPPKKEKAHCPDGDPQRGAKNMTSLVLCK